MAGIFIIISKITLAIFSLSSLLFVQRFILISSDSKLRSRGYEFITRIEKNDAFITNSAVNESTPNSSSSPPVSVEYTTEANMDLISTLPGLSFQPTFKQFSGYIPVSSTRKIHYWYIESSSNPVTDPLVWWTNGGPGCSGILGLGTEFGPFIFEKDGVLSSNPHTWNQVANIIYVEQPAGVGFSTYSQDDDKQVGDDRAARDNIQFILEFFKRFPERTTNDFYIASESFGGHYIPHFAKAILDHNKEGGTINFKGFLVGNPYVDPMSNDISMIQTYFLHGLIPLPSYLAWERDCTNPQNYDSQKCEVIVNAMFSEVGDGINPYALDYPMCTEADNNDYPPSGENYDTFISKTGIVDQTSPSRRLSSVQSSKLIQSTSSITPPFLPQEDRYHPCAEAHLFQYLNRDDVKKALHVENKDWSMCTDDIEYNQEDINRPQMYLYEELIAYAKQEGTDLNMMVFSGDDDSVCSTVGTQYWIFDIGTAVKEGELWKAWRHDNQTAGYHTQFDLGDTNSSFVFATVHGAGHEVPAYRPAEALAMVRSYFSGVWDFGSQEVESGTKG